MLKEKNESNREVEGLSRQGLSDTTVASTFARESLQEILDSFVVLTGIRAAYVSQSNELVSGKDKPMCSFCSSIRSIYGIDAACRDCDQRAFRQASLTGRLVLYRCHMGFWEAVTPVLVQETLVGYLMLGQVRQQQEDLDGQLQRQTIAGRLAHFGASPEQVSQFLAIFDQFSTYTLEQIKAAARMLELMARAVMSMDIIRLHETAGIDRVRQFLRQSFDKPISLQDVADHAGLNRTYLSDLYHRVTGRTLSADLNQMRLDKACSLLTGSPMTVQQIARACGFSDPNYFSRFFKKHMGSSPAAYARSKRAVQ